MTGHPIGINQRQETDDQRVLTFLRQMGGVRSHLCHFDTGALERMKAFKQWVDILIWRPRDDVQERLFRIHPDAAQYVRNCRAQLLGHGFQLDEVWLHLHNEAEWSFSMLEWEYKATLAAIALGMKVVVLNCSVGTPNENEIYMAEKIIRLAADHPEQVIVGLHEYFSVYGWRKRPWYLYRWSFWEKFRLDKSIGPVRYLITEFGADNISDDADYARQFLRNGHIPRGVHELDQAWARTYNDAAHNQSNTKPYPGLDQAYFEQLVQAYSTGNYAQDAVEAALIFCWGDEWPTFNISHMTVLHRLLAAWWQRNKPTAPLPSTPDPHPTPIPTIPPDTGDTKEVEVPITRKEFEALAAQVTALKADKSTLQTQVDNLTFEVSQMKIDRDRLLLKLAQPLAEAINAGAIKAVKEAGNIPA